jgi:hypothetical protein
VLERVVVVDVLQVPVPAAVIPLDPDRAASGVSRDREVVEPNIAIGLEDDLEREAPRIRLTPASIDPGIDGSVGCEILVDLTGIAEREVVPERRDDVGDALVGQREVEARSVVRALEIAVRAYVQPVG